MFDRIRQYIPALRKPATVRFDPTELDFMTPDQRIWYANESEAEDSFADRLEAIGLVGRIAGKAILSEAAGRIRRLVIKLDDEVQRSSSNQRVLSEWKNEARELRQKLDVAVNDAKEQARDLSMRTEIIIKEMTGSDGRYSGYVSSKPEKPAAIIYSPAQWANLTMHGHCIPGRLKSRAEQDLPSIRTFNGIPVYVAKGVYGPVVLTEDAFAGMSRMAPELHIKAQQ